MSKLTNKLRKIIVVAAALAVLLVPALAASAGETYSWQGTNHAAIVGTGGAYGSGNAVFSGPAPTYMASGAATCSDGSGQANLSIAVAPSDLQAKTDPTTGTVTATCDTTADTGQIQIFATAAAAKTAVTTADANPTCKGGILSWVVCPVYDFILNSVKSEENNIITPLLQLTPLSTSANSPPYRIWSQFRNLADVGFIIAFLVVIVAHTLSIGIDNYSLKKTLPRLVAAAILVQFSFVLVAFGIDLANILGAGIQALVLAPLHGTTLLVNNTNGTIGVVGVAVGIGAALAAAGGLLTGTLLLVLMGAFFAILGVVITLIARQIVVILLLIVSPLAFVAWVLPNTEHLFKYWRTSLIRLLLMYPMIMLLFAAGKLFSAAAIASSNSGSSGHIANAFLPLISVIAYIIPLFFIPFTFKYAGAAMNTVSGWIHGATMGSYKKIQSTERYTKAKDRVQQRKTELAAGQKINFMGAQVGGGAFSKQVGRGVFSVPGKGSDVRAMVDYNKDINGWKKRLEEENMTYEGVSYLSQGEKWYKKEHADVARKIADARRVGNLNEVAVQTEALTRLEDGKRYGSLYSDNSAARAAAMLRRSDMDVLSDDDRTAAMEYTGFNKDTQIGRLIGDQLWNRAREGARKTNVHLVFKDTKGNLDVAGLEKYVAKKPAGSWVDYTTDAIQTMSDEGVLQRLAQQQVTRQVLINTLSRTGGPSIGAEQQTIIEAALASTPNLGIKDDTTGT